MDPDGLIDEEAKAQMMVASMESLLDVRQPAAIFQKICDYARETSNSSFAFVSFFKHNEHSYEVHALSCEGRIGPEAITGALPIEPHREYELPHIAAFGRLLTEKGIIDSPTVAAFVGGDRGDTRQDFGLPCAIHQVICYPITLEKAISGALVLFLERPTDNASYFRIFSIQCSLVLQFSSQIKELEDKRRLEDQLHQAQKMEAIGQLAGGIAHDFNNMLSGITGYANLIKRKFGADKPDLRTFSDAIVSAATRASDLTSKLLAYARKGKYQTVAIDMHMAIQEAIALLEHTLDKRIRISQRFEAQLATITGDPTQIQNMVLNLAINGRDAMADGGDLIFRTETIILNAGLSMDGRYEISAGNYLVLSVTDTGIGMDESTKKRLFEPFFTTKEVGKGTGLGLASVYGTVKSHGGFIVVESEPGRGSTFRIYLPVAHEPPAIPLAPKTEMVIRGHGNVVVVDDEEMIRNLTKEILTFLGYAVVTCKDGPEAIAYFSLHAAEVDLVILDVIMPKMDGHETYRELQRIKPDVKVIITTGYSISEDTSKIINRGVAGFIQKPFESGPLSQLVHDVITGKQKKLF
jgi:signal transduction histidine kinase/CheY-like chemotaxis protein